MSPTLSPTDLGERSTLLGSIDACNWLANLATDRISTDHTPVRQHVDMHASPAQSRDFHSDFRAEVRMEIYRDWVINKRLYVCMVS